MNGVGETLHVEPRSSADQLAGKPIKAPFVKKDLHLSEVSPSSSALSDPPPSVAESGRHGTSRPDGLSTNVNVDDGAKVKAQPSSTSSSAEELSDLSRVRHPFSETQNTPTGSATSTSLVSPLPHPKSVSPSTQLNNSLSTATSSQHSPREHQSPLHTARPRSSIPSRLPSSVYAQQCVAAAYASRLSPYSLHQGELALLEDHLCHLHVTIYLHIRNGILRLWTRNPMVSVTQEEALGCAKDSRWMGLASVAYSWLVRNGYVNFGCVDVPQPLSQPRKRRKNSGSTIVIIGAGMAGLGCARHLQGLFRQHGNELGKAKIILLEGRKRIGGRIYSHPLHSLKSQELAPGVRSTAEMGAQIIVGFDHGNPLDPIIRAQLALRCHQLRDISTIYDVDGSPVGKIQDSMAEKLYNDILDRSGAYRHQTIIKPTAEGDRTLIDSGRDSFLDDGITIKQFADAAASGNIAQLLPTTKRARRGVGHKTADIQPPAGAPVSNLAETKEHSAALACQAMGWKWREGVSSEDTLLLDGMARESETQSLGNVMDEGVRQYQNLLPLTPKDMRLINWHFANLEYANASPADKLSLSGWDQDMGNEFDGEHAQVIGGYQQVPRGLWCFPSKLDVRTNKAVTKVAYDSHDTPNRKAHVHCEDGQVIRADKVVITAPLGVLKRKAVKFVPQLPDWKMAAIDRLGFGVMNKVILVFEKPFWDIDRDMFGLLREPQVANSLSQSDYAPARGKFYLFWNCLKTSGLPVLIALMAGEAAHEAECQSDDVILEEVTSQLRNIFKDIAVPDPLETIVTRWGQDQFSYGSYSNVATDSKPGDYDLMAKRVGNLYFAGEATCGTHPATVHGAYLSGLRAASELFESIAGPIEFPTPLVPPKTKATNITPVMSTPSSVPTVSPISGQKRKTANSNPVWQPEPKASTHAETKQPSDNFMREAYSEAMWAAIIQELGTAEPPPRKLALNPFLYYQKDYWHVCKARCDEDRRTISGNPNAKAGRDEVRQALGQMWRDASEEVKQPYLDRVTAYRQQNVDALAQWKERQAEWERKTYEVKDRWCAENPFEKFKQSRLKRG